MFPSDIFGFISGFFILIFVIAIIFFIVVIFIVYKLLHTNVDNVKKKHVKSNNKITESIIDISKESSKNELKAEKFINTCIYCGENIEDKATYCPYCGSNLK